MLSKSIKALCCWGSTCSLHAGIIILWVLYLVARVLVAVKGARLSSRWVPGMVNQVLLTEYRSLLNILVRIIYGILEGLISSSHLASFTMADFLDAIANSVRQHSLRREEAITIFTKRFVTKSGSIVTFVQKLFPVIIIHVRLQQCNSRALIKLQFSTFYFITLLYYTVIHRLGSIMLIPDGRLILRGNNLCRFSILIGLLTDVNGNISFRTSLRWQIYFSLSTRD